MIGEQGEIDETLKDSLDLLFTKITKILDRCNKVLPIVNALCSEGMKMHHWNKVCPCSLTIHITISLDIVRFKFGRECKRSLSGKRFVKNENRRQSAKM